MHEKAPRARHGRDPEWARADQNCAFGAGFLILGTNFARAALALARNHNVSSAAADAEATWGERSAPAQILRAKAAVAAGTTRAISARLPSILRRRRVRPGAAAAHDPGTHVRLSARADADEDPAHDGRRDCRWVGEARPAPVISVTIDTITLDAFKIAGIVVSTDDLIKFSSPDVDGLVRADLLAAVAKMMDQALLDPTAAAVAGVSPASITNGALQIAATGTAMTNLTADLAALFAELTSNGILLTAPYLIMAPQTAVRLSLMSTAGAGFLNLDTRGSSTIATVPVIASSNVASTIIVLVDAAELIVCDTDEISLDLSGRRRSS